MAKSVKSVRKGPQHDLSTGPNMTKHEAFRKNYGIGQPFKIGSILRWQRENFLPGDIFFIEYSDEAETKQVFLHGLRQSCSTFLLRERVSQGELRLLV